MKNTSVREMRNHYADLLKRVEAGEEIEIRRRGKPVAWLIPPRVKARQMDWAASAALTADKSKWRKLTAAQTQAVSHALHDSQGSW